MKRLTPEQIADARITPGANLRTGDRIELVHMPDDPDPIPAGSLGTVEWVTHLTEGDHRYLQIGVTWDSGRNLMLVVPPDVVRRVPSGPSPSGA